MAKFRLRKAILSQVLLKFSLFRDERGKLYHWPGYLYFVGKK